MDKVLVIGHSPGATDIRKRKNGSPSLNRLNTWLDACDVDIYSFSNLCAHHKVSLKMADIDETFVKNICSQYNKIIGLGGSVSHFLKKMDIEHFPAPHPSPRNRKFNDKYFEPMIMKLLKEYVNENRCNPW